LAFFQPVFGYLGTLKLPASSACIGHGISGTAAEALQSRQAGSLLCLVFGRRSGGRPASCDVAAPIRDVNLGVGTLIYATSGALRRAGQRQQTVAQDGVASGMAAAATTSTAWPRLGSPRIEGHLASAKLSPLSNFIRFEFVSDHPYSALNFEGSSLYG